MVSSAPARPAAQWGYLKADDAQVCLAFARTQHPDGRIEVSPHQGGCSYTLLVYLNDLPSWLPCAEAPGMRAHAVVLQFRPHRHAIDLELALAARCIHGARAPVTIQQDDVTLGGGRVLQVCAMSHVPGIRFSELQPKSSLDDTSLRKLTTTVTGLASFLATTWRAGASERIGDRQARCLGKIGSTMLSRLCRLERELPTSYLRASAQHVRKQVQLDGLSRLPIVLTHGDLLPSNIMADPETWALTGLVDWAEAEYLPFGLCLYGLEHLLGYADIDCVAGCSNFTYYEQACELRAHFWRMLRREIPELSSKGMRESVLLAREVGVMLWYGFAWDDGAVDRVVNQYDDQSVLNQLRTFLADEARDAEPKL